MRIYREPLEMGGDAQNGIDEEESSHSSLEIDESSRDWREGVVLERNTKHHSYLWRVSKRIPDSGYSSKLLL